MISPKKYISSWVRSTNCRLYSNISQILLLYKAWGYHNKFDSMKSLGVYYWCVKMSQCRCVGHGLEYITFCVAWRHQAITWTSVYASSVRSSDIQWRAISQKIPQPSIIKSSLSITYLKLHSNTPGGNGLINKANLRALIAVTSLNFCLKLDSNHSFFGPCDLQIWWMTSKNNRTPLLYYIKLCASFQTHWWIQTAVTVQKCSNWVRIGDFLSCVTLKFDGWPWQTIGHLLYATSSFVNHFKAINEFKLE